MSAMTSRRAFLRSGARLSALAMARPLTGGLALQLAAMGEAAAQTATDYKALVCVYLMGGNDHANTLVPFDAPQYAEYARLRGTLGLPLSALTGGVLTPLTPLPDGRQFALCDDLNSATPAGTTLAGLFNNDRALAPLLNIGTLVQPTSMADYLARRVRLPPKLFSHNDQQSEWLSGAAEGAPTGWGGRLGDLMMAGNGKGTFTCINVADNSVFLSGAQALQFKVTAQGPVALNGQTSLFGSAACAAQLQAQMTQSRTHLFEAELTRVARRSLDAFDALNQATTGLTLNTAFPATGNALADQLQYVAKMIAARNTLGSRRQVFLVALGGFDGHDNLSTSHPALLRMLGPALRAFYDATVELGVARQVTTFTASDFGRTLTSNGNGSDHGWGSMHFVLGGGVLGGNFYGSAPQFADGGPDDVGQGRLLPTMAVDQLAATLATWFGVSATDLHTVVPNLPNYTVKNLNILA